MSCPSRLRRLWREDNGMVAVMVAAMLTVLVGMAGAAVDLGVVYTARGQLQNAADAAALAAADTILRYDSDYTAQVDYDTAWATAQEIAGANQAVGVNLALLESDFVVGKWDPATGTWVATGGSDPAEVNAVQVTVRRDQRANSPVGTFFAGIVGVDRVELQATARAYVGYAGSVPQGAVALPIAVKAEALANEDGSPDCGRSLEFHSEPNENAEWTSFFDWPVNDPTVREYACGCRPSPELKVGDQIFVTNGNLSNHTFQELAQRFQEEGTDTDGDGLADEWMVVLPVVKTGEGHCGCSHTAEVVGFAYFQVTAVRPAPYKDVVGTLQCGMVVPDSATGGEDFGARADHPKLIQ